MHVEIKIVLLPYFSLVEQCLWIWWKLS